MLELCTVLIGAFDVIAEPKMPLDIYNTTPAVVKRRISVALDICTDLIASSCYIIEGPEGPNYYYTYFAGGVSYIFESCRFYIFWIYLRTIFVGRPGPHYFMYPARLVRKYYFVCNLRRTYSQLLGPFPEQKTKTDHDSFYRWIDYRRICIVRLRSIEICFSSYQHECVAFGHFETRK